VAEKGSGTRAADSFVPSASRWSLASLDLEDLFEELRARTGSARDAQERLGSLLDAVVAVSSNLDLAEVLHRIVVSACDLVDATYGALGVLGPSGEELVEFVTQGLTEDERAAIGPLPRGHGLLGLIITSPHPQRVSDIGEHPDSYGFPANHPPMTSFLGAPVRIRDQVFGNLYLTDKRSAKEFSEDDEAILVALAAAAGVAIDNARLYDRTRTQQLWGDVIRDATQSLLAGQPQGDVLSDVATRVCELTGASSCMVALTHESDLLVAASVAVDPVGAWVEPIQGPGSRVLDPELRSAMVSDARTTPVGEQGTRALVPLALGDAPLGILVVNWQDGERSGQLAQLATFGQGLAVSLGAASAQTERARSELYEDRDRIARDMHDHVIQRLFATGMSLQSAARTSDETARKKIDGAVDELDAAIRDIRHTIFALHRAPGARVLTTEISTICRDASVTLGFPPELRLSGRTDSVPEPVAADLLAVLREALSNVARHASASTVHVSVQVDSDVTVSVTDDGRGVPADLVRSGLDNLARRAEKRGGLLSVEAGQTAGTQLTWRVPLAEVSPED
jgi:signal transduction histidine kinase